MMIANENVRYVRTLSLIVSGVVLLAGIAGYASLFLAAILSNFILLHAIWMLQLAGGTPWQKIDWARFKLPLISFSACGLLGYVLLGR